MNDALDEQQRLVFVNDIAIMQPAHHAFAQYYTELRKCFPPSSFFWRKGISAERQQMLVAALDCAQKDLMTDLDWDPTSANFQGTWASFYASYPLVLTSAIVDMDMDENNNNNINNTDNNNTTATRPTRATVILEDKYTQDPLDHPPPPPVSYLASEAVRRAVEGVQATGSELLFYKVFADNLAPPNTKNY